MKSLGEQPHDPTHCHMQGRPHLGPCRDDKEGFRRLQVWNRRTNWAVAAVFATCVGVLLSRGTFWVLPTGAAMWIANGVLLYCRTQWQHAADALIDNLFEEEEK